jgi:hypothetical protein
MSPVVNVLAPIIQWKWIGAAVVGCHTLPASAADPPSSPEDDPLDVDPGAPELDPPELDPPGVDPPELDPPGVDPPELDPPGVDPPELDPEPDPPASVPCSGFATGDEPDDPQAVHQASTPSTPRSLSRSVTMAQRNSIVR